MAKKNIPSKSAANLNRFKNLFLIMYVLIIAVSISLTSVLTLNKTDTVLKSQISHIASSLNVQMKANLSSYLKEVESIGTLVFSDPLLYTYDASDPSNDEYESIQNEQDIANKLYNFSMLEDLTDFGIIYSNNHFVGKISNGTVSSFGESLYEDFCSIINRTRTSDGWRAGYQDNYKRIYYAKRINENAVLAVSFYSSELDEVFVKSSASDTIEVKIIDDSDTIIYSREINELGTSLNPEFLNRMQGSKTGTFIDNEYMISINECGDNWRIVQTAPASEMLKEKNEVQYFIFIIGIIAALIAVLITIFTLEKMLTPVSAMVNTLDDEAHTDLLTGVLNKRSFENYTQDAIASCKASDKRAVILLDIDNFKGVNDNLGHAYGDKVLAGVGNILKRVFNRNDFLGRLGGDEFCVFLNTYDDVSGKYSSYTEFINEKCSELCQAFADNYTGDDNSYKISASIGVAVFPDNGKSFGELYRCADTALYESKHRGKDTFTVYSEDLEAKK